MKIKVLGTGCKKCTDLYHAVEKVIHNLNISAELEKVEKLNEIMKYNVFMTPALVIDEVVKVSGRVPSEGEITQLLSTDK